MVFVLDRRKKPLNLCTEKRARLLLAKGRARVHRLSPFTIRLVDRLQESGTAESIRLKIDPGSKVTGFALVRESGQNTQVLWLGELTHRGSAIRDALKQRRQYRRRRRSANLRYRKPRFNNRRKPEGWLAPSLRHRVEGVASLVHKLCRIAPVTALAVETVRFDTQLIQNPEISGIEYQQGALAGYELREYLLEKWGRKCAYCSATNVPLQVEHIISRSRGGSDRASNLTLACGPCNAAKGAMAIEDFLRKKPELLARIKRQVKTPLLDAAAVNATRWAVLRCLKATTLPVESSSGGRTKWNRARLGIPKTHALDAACVGSTGNLTGWELPVLAVKSMGRGSYQRTRTDRYGFPRGYCLRAKTVCGFQTGDLVRADVFRGKYQGQYRGRVAVRSTGSFAIQTAFGKIDGVSHKYCRVLQRGDGYRYHLLSLNNTKQTQKGGGASSPA